MFISGNISSNFTFFCSRSGPLWVLGQFHIAPWAKKELHFKSIFFSQVNTRKFKSISFSMEVFSSIAVFCILCFDNHLATITSKKISNASMIIESKNPIILVHLVFFYGRRGDTWVWVWLWLEQGRSCQGALCNPWYLHKLR